ncbi:uncharacterized protein LOC6557466 [Drosophila grimshawi]|uniref:GH16100 n=1 Tax=Drosophila grimshawi TaxID=7222 RepID=B4J383_DROGR|nr:uncharacterized protein LOC6557466 [Drosophila grimshawi]EDV96154.1 GH16100 [Drosophila grimshawi]
MLRSAISISSRGQLPAFLMSSKGVAQSKLLHSYSYSRPVVVRFASNDNKIQGSSGIIGNIASSKSIGSDPSSCAQSQTTVLGSDSDVDKLAKKNSAKLDTADDSVDRPKLNSMKRESGKKSGPDSKTESDKHLDDTMKQLQAVAASLPSKDQVEKFVFRIVAFIYDIVYLTGNWTIRFVNENILQNATVKHYWKVFHDKMEKAKKD